MWTKLEIGNDWGYFYLAPAGTKKNDHGMCRAKRAVKFTEGQMVLIRWPDGTQTKECVVHKTYHDTVSDHGHRYGVDSDVAGIMLAVNGAEAWAPLHEVGEVWLEGDDDGDTG
jgi:hypothetical protein